jgi:hypothetical protein
MANLRDAQCPHLDFQGLRTSYAAFAKIAPYTLWRLVCLGLWWRRVVERKSLICVAS